MNENARHSVNIRIRLVFVFNDNPKNEGDKVTQVDFLKFWWNILWVMIARLDYLTKQNLASSVNWPRKRYRYQTMRWKVLSTRRCFPFQCGWMINGVMCNQNEWILTIWLSSAIWAGIPSWQPWSIWKYLLTGVQLLFVCLFVWCSTAHQHKKANNAKKW